MQSNIDYRGRIIRATMSLLILGVAVFGYSKSWSLWICLPLALCGLFVAFEALRGWCIARACGIKTRY